MEFWLDPVHRLATYTLNAMISRISICASRHDSIKAEAAEFSSAARSRQSSWQRSEMARGLPGYHSQHTTGTRQHGRVYPGVKEFVYHTRFPHVPSNQWFTLDVIAEEDAFAALVDGELSGYHTDGRKRVPSSGHIALQACPNTVIEFAKSRLGNWTV